MSDLNEIINEIYQASIKIYSDRKLSASNTIVLTAKLMEFVEKYKNISGIEKKQIVIDVLHQIVDRSGLVEDDSKKDFNYLINSIVPSIIDGLVSANNGQLNLGKEKKGCFFCF